MRIRAAALAAVILCLLLTACGSDVDAAESAPIENGGWEWVAPDGQAVDTLSGNATNVTPDGYDGGGTVKSGTYQWRSVAFDITSAQQGGTLSYTDGDGTTWRWTMPDKDTGPELAKLKAALVGG